MKNKILLFALALFVSWPCFSQNLKVMTYNIHHGADARDKDQLDKIAAFIKDSGADLVGLQEIDSLCKRTGNVDQMKRLGELTGMYYAFVRHMAYDGGAYGQGILSKYPMSDVRNNRLTLLKKNGEKDSRALISATITLPTNRKVIFASAHFALDQPSRLIQSNQTLGYLKNRKIPVIFTGDLNSEPSTQEVLNLETYFAKTDYANLLTFPVEVPVKKIDYIYVSKRFLADVKEYRVVNGNLLSDHLPAVATIGLKER